MSLKIFLFSLFALILLFPSLQMPEASAQTDSGNKWKVTVTYEHKGTDSDPYFFQEITAILKPDPNMPGSSMLSGNGTGTWQWSDPRTEQCPAYSGSGAFPAAVTAIIGEVSTAQGRELSIGLQAVPGRSLAEFEDFEKRYTVTCHSPPDYVFDEDRSSAPVPLLPQVVLKNSTSGWYGEEIGVQIDCCVAKFTVTLSPPEIKYRIYGTVMDIRKPMAESKVVLGDIKTISGGLLPLQKLSTSIPDFVEETTASADTGGYEFEVEGSVTDPAQFVIVSLLWYDGVSEFAVTNGQQVGGRYVPVYQAACVSDLQADNCVKWQRTDDGFEAEVNIQYGFASARQHSKVMLPEAWNLGTRDMGPMSADAAVIYYNSHRAMKYFESLKGQVGMPLNPVTIDIYNSHLPGCKNGDGTDKPSAFFDYRAKTPFGGLGSFLEQTASEGGTVTICTLESFKSRESIDAPINREYHELGHYLQNDMYYPSSNLLSGRGTPHAGYANDSTNDSLAEGFASFVALLVAEHYRQLEGGLPKYPVGTHRYNLEQDYRVWGDNARMFRLDDGRIVPYFSLERNNHEEWAVAGLLWDLHDRGQEFHVSHITSAGNDPTELWAPVSEVYNVTRDGVALFDYHILDNIRSKKPMSLVDLYSAFSGDVSSQDLDMVFISHGAFGDVSKRDLVHSVGESVGPTGSKEAPDRPVRSSPYPMLNGSYISAETDATFEVKFAHREPYSFYDYSYSVNMTKGEPAYFEMPPSYYPSVAQFFTISPSGQLSDDSSLTINSTEYWSYIYSKPQENAIFKTIEVTASQQPIVPVSQSDNSTGSTPSQPSGCLIATAAFGSELTPQVQFLRNFRDNHILSTASGSSFMNVFNAWYYSFSPQVADYEREQPWLQQTVRIAIYPLLGILQVAEKAYAILPGEFGSISAGIVASSLIASVYLTPLALLTRRVRESRPDLRILLAIAGGAVVAVIASVIAGYPPAMMVTTSILVVTMLVVATLLASRIITSLANRLKSGI